MTVIDVYPVPHGMTADDAYYEIETFGYLVEYRWWKPRFHWPFVKWAWRERDDG